MSKYNWNGWASLSRPKCGLSNDLITVGNNSDGRMEIFVTKGSLWHMYQSKANTGPWINWDSLGRPGNVPLVNEPIAERDSDGCLVVFVINFESSIWYRYQTESKKGPWSIWYDLGKLPAAGIYSIYAVGKNEDERLEVFVKGFGNGINDELWHNWQI